ncbi:hypothetical protein VN97_g10925 [Penicillium thymicola]|uniref:Uncharacterized protein n=1 Tax=Penicillium thymicola TaxID=293382 RepID=A0AAI9T948_PENTH|nr:hypothetical protein VN97_g10925 [Penicillium thymicola]
MSHVIFPICILVPKETKFLPSSSSSPLVYSKTKFSSADPVNQIYRSLKASRLFSQEQDASESSTCGVRRMSYHYVTQQKEIRQGEDSILNLLGPKGSPYEDRQQAWELLLRHLG